MLLGVVLLYVGVVLCVNGLWLIGQARAAAVVDSPAPARHARVPAAVGAGGDANAAGSVGGPDEAGTGAAEARRTAAQLADESIGGRGTEPQQARLEASPVLIQNREVTVINIFTGFVGVVAALILLVQGGLTNNLTSVRGGGFILLFAFTYLWVAFNQYLNAGGRAFGWYCLFVAVTAIPAGIYTLQNTGGNVAYLWLGINWFAWAVLWALFWALLALERPVARLAGWLAIVEGIGTSWALAIAVLLGALAF